MGNWGWNPYLRFPRASLAATALLCLPLWLGLARFEVSSEMRVLLETDARNLASYDKVRQILTGVEVVVLSLEHPALFTPAGIETVRRVSEAFAHQPGVVDVKSLTHSARPVRRGLGFEMVPLIAEGAPGAADLTALRRFALEHPLMRNVMVAADARHTFITVTYAGPFDRTARQRTLRAQVEATLRPFEQEGFRFRVIALPLVEEEIRSTLRRDLGRFIPAAAAVLTVVLWLTFRSWRVLVLVLANQAAALGSMPGLIALSGFRLNVFSVMLFPLLAGIHLTLLAHLFTAFQAASAEETDIDRALARTLDVVFKSALFATVTTVIGLMSLVCSGVRQVREFGVLGALSLCLVHYLTFGPGLAVLKLVAARWPLPAPRRGPGEETGDAWSGRFAAAVRRLRPWTLAVAAVTVGFSALGLGMIRTDIRAIEFLGRASPTRQAMEELDRVYGGVNVVQVQFDAGVTNGINQLPFLRYVEKVHRFAESRPDLSGAYSYPQLLAMMNQIWEGERPGSLRLPDNPLLIALWVRALQTYNFPFLTGLADPTFRTAYLVLRTRDMPSGRYLALVNEVVAFAERTRPPGVSVTAAQGIHSILEADRRIIRSQINSAGLTVAVIWLVLALLWRSAWLAALSLLTNIIPVAAVIAAAGYLQVPLNSITVMVAAISLGIAVDDSIHFITHWREERLAGAPAFEAVRRSFAVKGRPIVWTSVILIAICSVFWSSSFPPVAHFGFLSALAFAVALGAVLFFLPALLCLGRGAPGGGKP